MNNKVEWKKRKKERKKTGEGGGEKETERKKKRDGAKERKRKKDGKKRERRRAREGKERSKRKKARQKHILITYILRCYILSTFPSKCFTWFLWHIRTMMNINAFFITRAASNVIYRSCLSDFLAPKFRIWKMTFTFYKSLAITFSLYRDNLILP